MHLSWSEFEAHVYIIKFHQMSGLYICGANCRSMCACRLHWWIMCSYYIAGIHFARLAGTINSALKWCPIQSHFHNTLQEWELCLILYWLSKTESSLLASLAAITSATSPVSSLTVLTHVTGLRVYISVSTQMALQFRTSTLSLLCLYSNSLFCVH